MSSLGHPLPPFGDFCHCVALIGVSGLFIALQCSLQATNSCLQVRFVMKGRYWLRAIVLRSM
jgi:hypothetical protein